MADAADPIAERIALVMELRGWTAAELARRAGLQTPTHISTILKRGGERTSGTVLSKIAAARARACGVPLWAARWRMETRVLWAVEENHRQLY